MLLGKYKNSLKNIIVKKNTIILIIRVFKILNKNSVSKYLEIDK